MRIFRVPVHRQIRENRLNRIGKKIKSRHYVHFNTEVLYVYTTRQIVFKKLKHIKIYTREVVCITRARAVVSIHTMYSVPSRPR